MTRIAPYHRIPPQQLNLLEEQMQAYYAAVPDYPAFHVPSDHPLEWRHVLAEVRGRVDHSAQKVSILEFGAGRSGFPTWLRHQLAAEPKTAAVEITCQDVTATNRTYLQQVADHVVIAPLQQGMLPPANFDIIFSTHCLEHVAHPEQLLSTCINLLKPGGVLLLFAPRYDLPFYLSPSSSNLSIWKRILLSFRLLGIRLASILRGRPAFVIDTRPACLDRPFVRDADAIHWVSSHDLRLFARRHGLTTVPLDVSRHTFLFSKQQLINLCCKSAIALHKGFN